MDMRSESVSEDLEKVSTPLLPRGPVGPPKIIEVPENVTVPESKLLAFLPIYIKLFQQHSVFSLFFFLLFSFFFCFCIWL